MEMNTEDALDKVLSALTLSHLRRVVLEMAEGRYIDGAAGVPLYAIVDALVGERDLGTGAERWRARLRIKRAVIEMLVSIPEMKYVEGDA